MVMIVNIAFVVIERMSNIKLLAKQQRPANIKQSFRSKIVRNLAFATSTLQLDSIQILRTNQYDRKLMAKIKVIISASQNQIASKTIKFMLCVILTKFLKEQITIFTNSALDNCCCECAFLQESIEKNALDIRSLTIIFNIYTQEPRSQAFLGFSVPN